jgi:hypothetical protein
VQAAKLLEISGQNMQFAVKPYYATGLIDAMKLINLSGFLFSDKV